MGEQAKKSFIINVIFLSIWGFIIFFAGKFLFQYMFPFILAVVVAALMQKPAALLAKKTGLSKGAWAASFSAVLYIGLAAALIFAVVKLFSFAGSIIASAPQWSSVAIKTLNRLQGVMNSFFSDISPDLSLAADKITGTLFENVTEGVTSFLSTSVAGFVKSAPSFLFSSVVALAASCYIAKDFDGLKKFVLSFISEKNNKSIKKIKMIFKSSVFKMIWGYVLLMFITFGELCIGLFILRVESWWLWSAVIAVIDILPVLGAGAVLIPWGIINVILGNRFLGIGLLVLYLVITVIRNFSEPKIVGDKTGINPLFILLFMFIGLRVFGFAGIIILPVTFIVVVKYYKSEIEIENKEC